MGGRGRCGGWGFKLDTGGGAERPIFRLAIRWTKGRRPGRVSVERGVLGSGLDEG